MTGFRPRAGFSAVTVLVNVGSFTPFPCVSPRPGSSGTAGEPLMAFVFLIIMPKNRIVNRKIIVEICHRPWYTQTVQRKYQGYGYQEWAAEFSADPSGTKPP